MNGTRLEILKDGQWLDLVLSTDEEIQYNAVINKVGEVSSREISHTNTFSLAPVWLNTQRLGLNVFSPLELSKALNRKYEAKYYVEDKLLQKGFLVINNTDTGTVKVNFIDESLQITEVWGTTTYQELLRNTTLPFPADYQAAINELLGYNMPKGVVLTPTSEIGTRGYKLCLFPNNLNAIGEKFQLNNAEVRVDDAFNPYQSRPIFNAISLFDLATVGFGYTPIFDPSVDWDRVKRTYIVDKGLDASAKGNNGIQQVQHPTVSNAGNFFSSEPSTLNGSTTYTIKHMYDFSASVSKRPVDIANFSTPGHMEPYGDPTSKPWNTHNVIFTPSVEVGNVGTINIKADTYTNSTNADFTTISFIGIWKNLTAGSPTVDTVVASRGPFISSGPLTENTPTTKDGFDLTLDKVVFDTVPTGADPDGLIGMAVVVRKSSLTGGVFSMYNLKVTETYLPAGVVAYDNFGQYLPETVDLTHAAPNETIKSLLTSIMHKEGILINIDNNSKEIKFFTYGAYEQQKFDGNFSDWSKYLQKYDPFIFNTDYGNNYAKKNRIGLAEPFQGNTFDIYLQNQGFESKYKDYTTNYSQKFKDVENVREIFNTTTPYLEFENKGLGLVEFLGTLGQLSQQRADGTIQGNFTGLAEIANVNGQDLPGGVNEWYKLVDEAIRIDLIFLLPTEIIRNLNLSEPIFIEEVNGWYIIEEISEYINGRKPVVVKVIKLIDDLRGLGTGPGTQEPPPAPSITLDSTANPPNSFGQFTWEIVTNYSFNNYAPTGGVTIKAIQYTDYPVNGGVPTGIERSDTINISASQHTFASPMELTANDCGVFEIVITDATFSVVSNSDFVMIDCPSGPGSGISITATAVTAGSDPAVTDVTYEFQNFTPVSATLEIFSHDAVNLTKVGPALYTNSSLNLTANTIHAINNINLPNVPTYGNNYIIELTTDTITQTHLIPIVAP